MYMFPKSIKQEEYNHSDHNTLASAKAYLTGLHSEKFYRGGGARKYKIK